MDLDTYIQEQRASKKGTLRKLAGELGIWPSQLHDIKSGRRAATLRVAIKIRDLSKGAVTVDEINALWKGAE